jgi:hypothetical protein
LNDVILAQAEIKKNTIRGASGCRQTERVRSRETPLWLRDPRQMRRCFFERRGFARSNVLMKVTPSRLLRGKLLRPGFFVHCGPHRCRNGAALDDLIDRGDRSGADSGVAGHNVCHAKRHARLFGHARREGCGNPGIHRVPRRIGDADHIVAISVRAIGKVFDQTGIVGPEKEADFHILNS